MTGRTAGKAAAYRVSLIAYPCSFATTFPMDLNVQKNVIG